jgi:hypothetical protein
MLSLTMWTAIAMATFLVIISGFPLLNFNFERELDKVPPEAPHIDKRLMWKVIDYASKNLGDTNATDICDLYNEYGKPGGEYELPLDLDNCTAFVEVFAPNAKALLDRLLQPSGKWND